MKHRANFPEACSLTLEYFLSHLVWIEANFVSEVLKLTDM